MSALLLCQKCGKEFNAKRSHAKWCSDCRIIRAKERSQKYDSHHKDSCPDCGKPMVRRAERCLPCSNKHRGETYRAENSGSWKGGRTEANGYIYLRTSHTGGGSAYTGEHRLVWEQRHGKLPRGWVVHHLNGIRDDNRIENLNAMSRRTHSPRLMVEPYQRRIKELENQLELERG